jgi:hypothetical protein
MANTHGQHTWPTHMFNTHGQHTCSTHMANTHGQHTCSTHMFNTHVQHTCSTHMANTHVQHTCSTHLVRVLHQEGLVGVHTHVANVHGEIVVRGGAETSRPDQRLPEAEAEEGSGNWWGRRGRDVSKKGSWTRGRGATQQWRALAGYQGTYKVVVSQSPMPAP